MEVSIVFSQTKSKPAGYREAEPRASLPPPPVGAVPWLVSWLDGNLRRTVQRVAQTAHQAWRQVPNAPHFSQCRVRLWGAR